MPFYFGNETVTQAQPFTWYELVQILYIASQRNKTKQQQLFTVDVINPNGQSDNKPHSCVF